LVGFGAGVRPYCRGLWRREGDGFECGGRHRSGGEINGYVAENPVIIIIATWPMQLLTTKCVVGVNDVSYTRLQIVWDTRPLGKLKNCGSSQ
jgi:hypothetical protein